MHRAAIPSSAGIRCCASPPITETSYLLTDRITGETNYYFCQWSDNSTAIGRRCGLFDKTGAECFRWRPLMTPPFPAVC